MHKKVRATLGETLERARQTAGLSVRQLAEAADVPKSGVGRLLRDDTDRPNAEHLVRLAAVLELRASDLFLLVGIPVPQQLPSVEALLRAEYDLPESAVQEAKTHIEAIVKRYQPSTNTRKEGTHEGN